MADTRSSTTIISGDIELSCPLSAPGERVPLGPGEG
jgi:hypothetical protein